MKRSIILALLLILLLAACSDKDKLVQVDIQNLNVPQDFNYNMNRQITVDIQGPYRLPVSITTLEGNLLFRAYLIPEQGISTRLSMPTTIKKVLVHYRGLEQEVSLSGNSISYNFNNSR